MAEILYVELPLLSRTRKRDSSLSQHSNLSEKTPTSLLMSTVVVLLHSLLQPCTTVRPRTVFDSNCPVERLKQGQGKLRDAHARGRGTNSILRKYHCTGFRFSPMWSDFCTETNEEKQQKPQMSCKREIEDKLSRVRPCLSRSNHRGVDAT